MPRHACVLEQLDDTNERNVLDTGRTRVINARTSHAASMAMHAYRGYTLQIGVLSTHTTPLYLVPTGHTTRR